jgi:spermidine synthase
VAIGLGLVLAIGLVGSDRLDRTLTGLSHPGLAATRDTPYGRVTVSQQDGQVAAFANDALLLDTEGIDAEEFVHLAALQVERPARVLLLGGSAEGLATQVLTHGVSEVVALELDAAFVETALPYLDDATWRGLANPRVRRVTDDPRAFLRRASAGTFDLILISMGEPESGQTSRFYSVEFLAQCQQHLAPGGVVGFRLQGAENLRAPILRRRTASVWRAARQVFTAVLVLPGGRDLFLAADRPLVRDPGLLSRRWLERGISARLVSPGYLAYRLTDDRLPRLEADLASTPAAANTDSRPVCYALTQILWLSRFVPGLAVADVEGTERWLTRGALIAIAAWIGALLAARQRERWGRACWAAVAGGCGMALEGALILGYQARQGALFRDLGILLTLYMAGLAAGVVLLAKLGRARRWPRRTGVALGLGLAGVAGASALALSPGGPEGVVLYGALLLATGLLSGGIFAYAARPEGPDPFVLVRPLYAADLAGGCLGSLAAGLALLPVLGLSGTALLMAGLAASLLVLP